MAETVRRLVVFCPFKAKHSSSSLNSDWEAIVQAVEELAPGVELLRPGILAVPAQGPVGYAGSDSAAARRIRAQVETALHEGGPHSNSTVDIGIGIAEGLFAGLQAAQRNRLIPAGQTREFLARLSITAMQQLAWLSSANQSKAGHANADQNKELTELVDLLQRLGLRTLGDFAALSTRDVTTRFGRLGLSAHQAARGIEHRPVSRRIPPTDLAVSQHFDPPASRIEAVAFAAKPLAEELHARLHDTGQACLRLGILAETTQGQQLHRVWHCLEPLTPADTAHRVRWQLEGWLQGSAALLASEPGSTVDSADSMDPAGTVDAADTCHGIHRLTLRPEETVDTHSAARELQKDLLNSRAAEQEGRAHRAFTRVQSLLGHHSVYTGILGGGRDPDERVRWVPWGDPAESALNPEQPWPGQLPPPSPGLVLTTPWTAEVLDHEGHAVHVTERHTLTAEPHRVRVTSGPAGQVIGWAGPWPVEKRWWAHQPTTQWPDPTPWKARLQVVLDDQQALLLSFEDTRWWVQGVYR